MIASDKKFLKFHRENNINPLPDNEKGIRLAGKAEQIFTALGGAVLTYASSKQLSGSRSNNLFHLSMAIMGGAMALRGIKIFKNESQNIEK